MIPIIVFAGAAALLWHLRRPKAFDAYAPAGTVTLYKGVPYRMAIRSQIGSGAADVVARVQETIRNRISGTPGTTAPTFLAIDHPPTWLPAGALGWGRMLSVFDVTPSRDDQTAVGRAVEGLGNIEWMMRLDGKSFTDLP